MIDSAPESRLSKTLREPTDRLRTLVRETAGRVVMPISVYPGLALTHATVRDLVTNSQAQAEATLALHARFRSPVILSAMDLSAEAEAFAAEVHFEEQEVPAILRPILNSLAQVQTLAVPSPGDGRTAVYLETVRKLKATAGDAVVLGGCIGPFSLAGRLIGVTEAFGLMSTDPALMHELIGKCARFLADYVRAFQAAGADGVIAFRNHVISSGCDLPPQVTLENLDAFNNAAANKG